MTAEVLTALCPACRHAARLHGDIGCGRCDCSLTGAEVAGAPAQVVAPPPPLSSRALDLLDPPCRCGHRRGKHQPSGGSGGSRLYKGEHRVALACSRCGCRQFTTVMGDADAATPPPRDVPELAATAGAEARSDETAAAEPATRRAGQRVAAPKRPRRQDPRPADVPRAVSAVVGEDDADQEVVTAGTGATGPAVTTPTLDVEAVIGGALMSYAAWYCPRCHARRGVQTPCCRRTLQPCWVVVLPREVA